MSSLVNVSPPPKVVRRSSTFGKGVNVQLRHLIGSCFVVYADTNGAVWFQDRYNGSYSFRELDRFDCSLIL